MRRLPPPVSMPGQPTWTDVQAACETGMRQAGTVAGAKSFERVYAAMTTLRDRREAIGFGSVASVCRNRFGGPTEGSIRNNRPLADLVRIAIATEASHSRARIRRSVEDEILEQIGDPRLRAEAEGIFADRRTVRVERDQLRKAFHEMEAIAICSREMIAAGASTLAELAGKAAASRAEAEPAMRFDASQVAAVRDFLAEGLKSLGLEIHEKSGAIINSISARTVGLPGLASALRLIAG